MPLLIALVAGLTRLNDRVLVACRYGVIVLVAAIVTIVSLGVFFRFVLNNSLPWTEEIAKFVMVWMTFVGAPIVLRQGGHIAIDFLPRALPRVPRHLVLFLVHAVVISVLSVLVFQGLALALNALPQVATTVKVSLFYIFLAVPIGSGIMLSIAIEQLLREFAAMFVDEDELATPASAGLDSSGFS